MVQMETDSPVVYHGTSESRFPPEEIKRSQVQLTAEEMRVLRDCNRESFYYRCLPFAVAGMAATFLATKKGILSSHPKWGPALKMTGAAFAGWVLGKVSYRSKCEEKFLHLENSTIGNALRKKRGYSLETFESDRSQFSNDESSSLKHDNYSTYSSGDFHSSSSSLNFDQNVPFSELDDRERPTVDNNSDTASEQSQPVRQFASYDELRRRNRENYEKQYYQPEISNSSRRPWSQNNSGPSRGTNVGAQQDVPKNAYGDTWDNPKFN